MTTVHIHENEYYRMTKGAIDRLLNHCNRIMTKEGSHTINRENIRQKLSLLHIPCHSHALRVLAAAYQVEGHKGLVGC